MSPEQIDKAILIALEDGRRSLAELAVAIKVDARYVLRRLNVLMGAERVRSCKVGTCLVYHLSGSAAVATKVRKVAKDLSAIAADEPSALAELASSAPISNTNTNTVASAKPARRKPVIVQRPLTVPEITVQPFGEEWVSIQSKEPDAKDSVECVMVRAENVPALIEALRAMVAA